MEKLKTVDGERTRVNALNTGPDVDSAELRGLRGRLRQFARNASLVMAGMYIGLNCYGTPNAEHDQEGAADTIGNKPSRTPDRRPI